jgi:hypothetical protein
MLNNKNLRLKKEYTIFQYRSGKFIFANELSFGNVFKENKSAPEIPNEVMSET